MKISKLKEIHTELLLAIQFRIKNTAVLPISYTHTHCTSTNLTPSTSITHFTANNMKRNVLILKCKQEGHIRQCQLSGQLRCTYWIFKLRVTVQPTANYINRTQFVQLVSYEYTAHRVTLCGSQMMFGTLRNKIE
jgi:hypothetical protein